MCSEGSSLSGALISQAGIPRGSTAHDLWDCSTCAATSRIKTYSGWGFLFLCFVAFPPCFVDDLH